jgi:hypothetical protein
VPIPTEVQLCTEYLLAAEKPVFLDMSNYTSDEDIPGATHLSRYGVADLHQLSLGAIAILHRFLRVYRTDSVA